MAVELAVKSIVLSNGETMAYRESGSGNEVIILVHGNMTSSKHWDVVMNELTDYKVYAVDLRGFGFSTYNNEINSLQDFADDVKLFTDEMGLSSFTLVGWSTGGGVAMQFAATYPEVVKSIVLIESVGISGYPIFKKDENGAPLIGEFLKTKDEIATDPIQVAPVLQALQHKDTNFYRTLWNMVIYTQKQPAPEQYEAYLADMLTQRNLVDVNYSLVTFNISHQHNGVVEGSGAVSNIKAPVLIIQGDRDYVVPMTMAEGIHEAIPHSKLVVLEDCGHSPLVDCLDELVAHIRNFIA
ncbi:alpha/beta hydrolase [Ectobacillus sp. JY-23]|uniref:intracellular short-chain-length polyhydroxyalkanoate depolymerase n=1 Tax=Ectobacillus sp. JY-23 TaxID=2933872 RepID=UPI001FF3700F|nr:alpha/beta hydrolase [Ectobacillus sp. JY-23]UOY93056.1 alpha/beta hydrolase [Ectobacillus sp. JY-23]